MSDFDIDKTVSGWTVSGWWLFAVFGAGALLGLFLGGAL